MGNVQFGFSFEEPTTQFAPNDFGTWCDPEFTFTEYQAKFCDSLASLSSTPAQLKALFEQGIRAAASEVQSMADRTADTNRPFRIYHPISPITAHEYVLLLGHCQTMLEQPVPGARYKIRHFKQSVTAGVYIEGIGSLVAQSHVRAGVARHWIEYQPWQCAFFMDSYRDDVKCHELPAAVWADCYCADQLSMANEKIVQVPTFPYFGREYVNTGGVSMGNYRECDAWAFVPKCEWTGALYTYKDQVAACETGQLERGDRRGLMVKVRGQICVLSHEAVFYDDNAESIRKSAHH